MPKHTRSSSSAQGRYSNAVPVSLAPSAIPIPYSRAPQPLNTNIHGNFYGTVPSPASPQLPLQAHAYDQYPVTVAPSGPLTSIRASSGAWTPQEDRTLMEARQRDMNWQKIANTFFTNRKSANACRKRHERLKEKRDADDWDHRKMEILAKEYMSMRKEIWQGLAAKTGEKWTVVEQKCMANGLKSLQSASRAATRRELQTQRHSIQGYDDDSGVSGIGLTQVDDLDPSYSSPETSSSHSHHSSAGSYGVQHPHAHQHPMSAGISYGSAGGGGYASSYSSSVSSIAQGYNGGGGPMHGHHPHHSQDGSPYMGNGQRPSSAEMGIESIIHPPRRRS